MWIWKLSSSSKIITRCAYSLFPHFRSRIVRYFPSVGKVISSAFFSIAIPSSLLFSSPYSAHGHSCLQFEQQRKEKIASTVKNLKLSFTFCTGLLMRTKGVHLTQNFGVPCSLPMNKLSTPDMLCQKPSMNTEKLLEFFLVCIVSKVI